MTNTELDAIDRQIIAALRENGRLSNLDLAALVGLSPTPCSRRVKRLETEGVILGYSARIDPVALGHGISVMINVRLASQKPSDIKNFVAAINDLPEITECLLVTGALDYILRVRASNVEAIRDFVLTKLKSIPCVSETTTLLILETVKSEA